MGILGQLPHAPDELPGHQVTSGEPPVAGGKAGELPTLGAAASLSISLTPSAATIRTGEKGAGPEAGAE